MIEELETEWIEYHEIGFDFWATVKKSKRLLLHDLCNNSSMRDLAGGCEK